MMLVNQVLTITALLLVTFAAAEKPTTIDESSVDVNEEVRTNGPLLDILWDVSEDPPDAEYRKKETFGKDLDSEENLDEYDDDDEDNDDDDEDNDEDDDDDDNDNSDESEESAEEGNKGNDRFKRKVIFRGGGGGGMYSRGSRRGGGHEEDPYGRRRDQHGPGYGPYDSWPYRRTDTPYEDSKVISSPTSSTKRESVPVYATRITIPESSDHSRSSGSSSSSSSSSSLASSSSSSSSSGASSSASSSPTYGKISNASRREEESKRTKTERRESSRAKLSKNMKWEIAQYALQHGAQKAAGHFEERIGKKLRVKKIEKFVKKYQSKM